MSDDAAGRGEPTHPPRDLPDDGLTTADRDRLTEIVPLLRRCAGLDPDAVTRLWLEADRTTALVRLPFGVLAARAVALPATGSGVPAARARDVTCAAADVLAWHDDPNAAPPQARDRDWRGGTPPRSGWRRLDVVPDGVIRPLVRSGALALKDAAAREGVPGARPRAEVADALLDAVVLTVEGGGETAEVTLRQLSALTRMGFLPRGGSAAVEVCGRWVRVVAGYGAVHAERAGATLTVA